MKCISETPHNEIKYVLSVKESNFNGRNGSTFSHMLTVSLTAKYLPFLRLPKVTYDNIVILMALQLS